MGRPELKIHSIRHTFASILWSMTHNLNAIKDALGHCTPSTTIDYIVTPEDTLIKYSSIISDYWDDTLVI